MLTNNEIISFLKKDVAPALGCTEPVCVALCAAYASRHTDGDILEISVEVNANIYKNGMSAGIPHFNKVGLEYAAALGALLKNPGKELELLEDITPEIAEEAARLIERGAVSVAIDPSEKNLYVSCELRTRQGRVRAVIRDSHTNLVEIQKEEQIIFEKSSERNQSENHFVDALKQMKLAEIRLAVDSLSEEELLFMLDGADMNEKLAAYSETHSVGVGIADTLRRQMDSGFLTNSLMNRIQLLVSSAAESRLDGCPLSTMSSSGAGTKGLVVILPISETAKTIGSTREQEVKALAFGHLVNRYINASVGKLSAMCTCAMASSTAASAAITWLLGGNDEQIGHAVRNMTGTITGMVCDGGKVGCAMKVSISSTAALLCALTAIDNSALRPTDGICSQTPEDCIANIARIANQGMQETDRVILNIMEERTKRAIKQPCEQHDITTITNLK